MIGQLTKSERQYALLILLGLALIGLIFGIAGKDDPLGVHGALVGVAALAESSKSFPSITIPNPVTTASPAITTIRRNSASSSQ